MITLLIVVVISLALCYWCTRTFGYWEKKNIAGPRPIPFFGNIKESVLRQKSIGMIYKELYDQYPDEKVVGFYRMTSPTLLIRNLDLVKEILIKNFEIFSDRGVQFSKKGLGDNLFHCDIYTWQVLRKRMTPAFSTGRLKNAYHLLDTHADKFVNYLENVSSICNEQDVHRLVQKYTMATVMCAIYGLDVEMYNDKSGIIEQAGHYIFKTTYASEADMLFPNILQKQHLSLYNDTVKRFCYEVVKIALELRTPKISNPDNVMDIMLSMLDKKLSSVTWNGVKKKDYLQFTKHAFAGQVFILFAAGFGNNALSISYALFQLAKNPDCQDKLIKEIDETLAKYDGVLSLSVLKEMPYLKKVFSEIIRMNPLTGAIPRSASKNYRIPNTDVVIEKGTTVIISPYAIHRDERLYPNPDQFDPERFSVENCKDRHPCAYIPFGAGPRSCLGQRFAYIQFATAIVKIFSKFRIEPSKKTKKIEDYDPMCTLIATKGGVYVNILPRNP